MDKRTKGVLAYHKGYAAEEAAARALAAEGIVVLGRRLRTPYGEIDLLVRDGTTLVIVEVKARADAQTAFHALKPRQLQRLQDVAAWLPSAVDASWAPEDWSKTDLRIDLVAVDSAGRVTRLENITV